MASPAPTLTEQFQALMNAVLNAVVQLAQGIAGFIAENAPLFAMILGFAIIGVVVIRYGRRFLDAIVGWVRELL
jgi:hypothetical protein